MLIFRINRQLIAEMLHKMGEQEPNNAIFFVNFRETT